MPNVGFMKMNVVRVRPQIMDVKMEKKKEFVGVLFECCNVYRRIYINKDGNGYEGRCPKCSNTVNIIIGPEGTSSQFFKVD